MSTPSPAAPAARSSDSLCEVQDAIDAIAAGEIVIVVDDENRENEGDLVVAAQYASPQILNFMITHGRGLVCLALTSARARQLQLEPMVEQASDHMGTAFTVSIDGSPAHGVRTGISAFDRAKTIALALSGTSEDLTRPGHMFPLVARDGGVLERQGHTEAAVELARLAGLQPAGVIVEIVGDDGEMLRRDSLAAFARRHRLLMTSIELLCQHVARPNGVKKS